MTKQQYLELMDQWVGYPDDRGMLAQIWEPKEIDEGRREAMKETGGLMRNWRVELAIETRVQISQYMREHEGENVEPPEPMDKSAEIFCKWYRSALCRNHVALPGKLDHSNTELRDIAQPNLLTFGNALEVKAIRNYIPRNNDGNTPCGSPYFELFNSAKPGTYAGWMLALFDPATFNAIKAEHRREERAVPCDNLTLVLERANETPFATIVFEDVPKLKEVLRNLCPDPDGWGLNDLRKQREYTDLYWKQYNREWNNEWGKVIKNNWHIPFEKLKDVATVTMIAPDVNVAEELERAQYKPPCPEEVATARVNNLKHYADETGCGTFDPATFRFATNPHLEPLKITAMGGGQCLERDIDGNWKPADLPQWITDLENKK